MEITLSEQQTENQMNKKKKKKESNVRDLWDIIKACQSIHNRDPRRRRKREGGLKIYLKKFCLKMSQT